MQRRSRFLVLALLLWTAPAWALTPVGHNNGTGAPDYTSPSFTITAGDTVAVCTALQNNVQIGMTIGGATATCETKEFSTDAVTVETCYVKNAAGGSETFTTSSLGSNSLAWVAYDVPSNNTARDAICVGNTAGSSLSCTTGTLGFTGEYAIGCVGLESHTATGGSGAFSAVDASDVIGSTYVAAASAANQGTAAVTGGFSFSGSSWDALQITTFQGAAGVVPLGSTLAGPSKLAGPGKVD